VAKLTTWQSGLWGLNHGCVSFCLPLGTRKYRVWAMLTTRVEEGLGFEPLLTGSRASTPINSRLDFHRLVRVKSPAPWWPGARARYLELTWKSSFMKSENLYNWFKVSISWRICRASRHVTCCWDCLTPWPKLQDLFWWQKFCCGDVHSNVSNNRAKLVITARLGKLFFSHDNLQLDELFLL
jgi:hypothetical protein